MSRSISLQNGHRRQTAIIISEKAIRDAMEKSNVYKNANLNLENMSKALVEFQNHPKCHPWQKNKFWALNRSKTAVAVGVWNNDKEAFCDCTWVTLIENHNQ